MRSVLPLETRSTIASARPSRGASSTEPSRRRARRPGSSSRASRGKLVATRAPRRSSSDCAVDSVGTAASSEQAPKPSRSELDHVGAALAHDVEAGDAAVDDAVLHVLGDVVGAHEQRLDRRVPARERERAVARRLGAEPRVVQELDRGLAEPPLRGDGDSQVSTGCAVAAPARTRPRRCGATAPPASPSSSTRAPAARPPGTAALPSSSLRHLPAVRHRVQLRPRAEVAEEALHLVRIPERGDRLEELSVFFCRPMSGICRCA